MPRRQTLRLAAVAALLAGIAALVLPPRDGDALTWEALLAPYSHGAPLLDGFRIDGIWRGAVHDVVLSIRRPGDADGVEVHILPRGVWSGIPESRSFGIAYETARSPAPQREAITALLVRTIRARDHGLPAPTAIALGRGFALGDASPWPRWLRGWDGALLVASVSALAALAWRGAPPLAAAGLALGALALLTRLLGGGEQTPSVVGGALDLIDAPARALQGAWLLLLLAAPWAVGRVARALACRAGALLGAVSLAAALALAATWTRGDEPLHANGHAWREAREVLVPWGARADGAAPFMHGRGAAPLQWLLADVERRLTGRANPFAVSRFSAAMAAAGAALLTAVLVGSPLAGLAAGAVVAGMPLARTLAVSGSALGVAASLLPWSLALVLAAARSGDRVLLAAGALAAGLGTLSHTAMLAWPPALGVAWVITARRPLRFAPAAVAALLLVAAAWGAQAWRVREMIVGRDQESSSGLLGAAWLGLCEHNLLADAQWVSPLLLPLVLLWGLGGLRRAWRAPVLASLGALLIAAAPFFAVTACSSDAIRYQGALLPLTGGLAVAGLWALPLASHLGGAGRALLRLAALAGLILLPRAAAAPGIDPAVLEHALVVATAPRIAAGTMVVLPERRMAGGRVLADFPDFLLPEGVYVKFAGDPGVGAHRGPVLRYLGLACVSWLAGESIPPAPALRPECEAVRGDARPWAVRALARDALPRDARGAPWTFHRLATEVPFGFFAARP